MILATVFLLSGCAGTVVVIQECDCPTANETPAPTAAVSSDANVGSGQVKTGLSVTTSVKDSTSAAEGQEGAVKYELYCSTDNETWTKLTTTTGTTINHNSGVAGTRYYYKVKAIASNSAANSAYSAVKNGYCDLARPTLAVTLNSKDKPYLSWTKIAGAVKYEVYRSTDNKTWTKLSTTTGTSLTNTSAVSGTTYYYKVRAIASNSAANSAYSTVKSITAG